ncbi:MAG TPA: alpha/beta hydrolase [Rubrobacter sp.]|nr:alpha/beta hydrolase [Rubrobacter sp.]
MTLHPALRELIDEKLANTVAPQWRLPIGQVRSSFRAFWSPAVTGAPVEVASVENRTVDTEAGAVPVRVFTPEADSRVPIMMYFHGGGYVKGGLDETDVFCRRLARTTGYIVVSVEYRLSPEHRFPAALDDAYACSLWAYQNAEELGGTSASFSVSGESAGGNLAAVTCLIARTDEKIEIRRQILLQPVVDFTLSFPSIGMPATECLVPRDDLAWYYGEYYSGDTRDFRVSPIFAEDLSSLPPALIITAEHDTLRDEGEAYADRLQVAGVPTQYSCYSGMIHGFLLLTGLVDEAQQAIDEIAAFTKAKI